MRKRRPRRAVAEGTLESGFGLNLALSRNDKLILRRPGKIAPIRRFGEGVRCEIEDKES